MKKEGRGLTKNYFNYLFTQANNFINKKDVIILLFLHIKTNMLSYYF